MPNPSGQPLHAPGELSASQARRSGPPGGLIVTAVADDQGRRGHVR